MSVEQEARDMLERLGHPTAQDMSAGEIVELANLINDSHLQVQLKAKIKELEEKQSPLLQCVSCRNTESPAGAMARYFNNGRCAHCGGYFKVIRA